MSQPRGPVAYAEGSRQSLNKKGDDAADRKKTQTQRLLEFEMWTNDKTLKDLEYSQRRTEKKQRRRERKKDAIKRCWQKLYIPAVVGMVGGTFLTLCGTLQSLGGDTVFWTVRTVLTVLGPALLGLGFLCLMLAAGCTFKHDQHMRQKPKRPPCEFQFLLDSSLQFQDRYSRGRQARKSETVSVDTEDLPVPADLDSQKNFVHNKAWVGTHRKGSVRSNGSASSSAFLLSFDNKNSNHNHNNNNSHKHNTNTIINNDSHNHNTNTIINNDSHKHNTNTIINNDSSFNSTASWVHSVSASHRQSPAELTRQNSDSNLRSSSELCSCGECHFTAHDSFVADSSELHDQSGSQSELHVACTRSLTSSGYQSAGDSPTSVADYRVFVPRESSTVAAKFTVGPSFASSRHNVRHLSASAAVSKNLFNSPRRPSLRRGSLDSGTRQTCCVGFVGQGIVPAFPPTHVFKGHVTVEKPTASGKPISTRGLPKHHRNRGLIRENRLTEQEQVGQLLLLTSDKPEHGRARNYSHGDVVLDIACQSHDEGGSRDCVDIPIIIEPMMYVPGTVRCTDV